MPQTEVNTLVGRSVGGFQLETEIGRGGMGVVYKAVDDQGGTVAVKILAPHLVNRPVIRQRFLKEADLAMRLEHPNLVRALAVGEEDGLLFIAMEFVDGESLAEYVARVGPLPEKAAIHIAVGVARALHKAHREGLVHRDVKPDNVLLSRQGHVKLADLGLVKDLDNDQHLTKVDRGVGTPASMAPEQFRDAKFVDQRSDIYGLGYVLYVAVTGKLPFEGGTSVDLFLKKRSEDYIRPEVHAPGISDRTSAVIIRCLSADPVRRPETAREFVELLLGDRPIEAPSTPKAPAPIPIETPLRPPSKSTRALTDSLGEIGELAKQSTATIRCTAIQEEMKRGHWLWLDMGAALMLAGRLAGFLLLGLVFLWLLLRLF
jgi:eukaryotic-like serine/threonine-protein kinase